MPKKENPEKVRIDRWLWSVRLYKTRSLATEACKKSRVRIDGSPAKPSKEISVGDVISIKIGPLEKIVRVDAITVQRTSAALAADLVTDLTSEDAYKKAKQEKIKIGPSPFNLKGKRRPRKKLRRELDEFLYPTSDNL